MTMIIVEDDKLLLENLNILLRGESRISVEGAFSSAEEALPAIREIVPDVLLVDIGLPGLSGIDLIKNLKEEMPDIDVMAHTVFDSRDTVFAAIKAGASGYLLKGGTPRELIESLHILHEGGAPMSPRIVRAVINEFQDRKIEEQYILTPREREILISLEGGYTYKQIADDLCISHHTVHSHIKNIYEKLHAKGRQEALITARKKGII
jgi:DNA-binding NarL/FixJ family response regulator